MSTAYLYGRHSTDMQSATEEVQREACEAYYKGLLKAKGVAFGGWHYDPAVSGGKNFSDRPSGAAVWVMLEKGDYLVVANLDRAFRSVVDGLCSVDAFRHRGINLVMLDYNIDTSTAGGEMLLTILLAGARMQRRYISERTRAVVNHRISKGIPHGQQRACAPIGWMLAGGGNGGYLPDEVERRQVDTLAQLRDEGLSFERIYYAVHKPGLKEGMRRRYTTGWTKRSIREAIKARSLDYPRTFLNSRERRRKAGHRLE